MNCGLIKLNRKRKSEIFDLIQYLFHNNSQINQFNILPKLVLLIEKEKKYNNVHIEKVNVIYDIRNGQANSKVIFDIRGMKNNSKVKLTEFYLYTGTDIGFTERTRVYEEVGNNVIEYNMRLELESNGIKRLVCGLQESIEYRKNSKNIKFETDYCNTFDLSQLTILYCYPLNFGLKVDEINYYIKIHDNDNYTIESRKVYKSKKEISEKILKTSEGERIEDYSQYNFKISDIHQLDIFYFTINRK